MKINWKTLLICIAIPLAAGGVSALISMGGMQTYNAFVQPPLAPPGWLFPVVWTVLYILMGVASYLVYTAEAPNVQIEGALKVYALQLFFNFCNCTASAVAEPWRQFCSTLFTHISIF